MTNLEGNEKDVKEGGFFSTLPLYKDFLNEV